MEPLDGSELAPTPENVSDHWVKRCKIVESMGRISDLIVALYGNLRGGDEGNDFLARLVGLVLEVHRMFWVLDQIGEDPAVRLGFLREKAKLRRIFRVGETGSEGHIDGRRGVRDLRTDRSCLASLRMGSSRVCRARAWRRAMGVERR